MKIGQNQSELVVSEPVARIEPFTLRSAPNEIAALMMKMSAGAALLENALHPKTAAHLASAVRIMNSYYSNMIEGNNTRPREIKAALSGKESDDAEQRNLQAEAAAHVRVQVAIDDLHEQGNLPAPTSSAFIRWIHREFFKGVSESNLHLEGVKAVPGTWRADRV